MKVDAIAHIPTVTLLLHSDCSELAKKNLFDFYYLLLRERTLSLMNILVPLGPERGYADGANYPPFSFSGSVKYVVLSGTKTKIYYVLSIFLLCMLSS